MDKWWLATFSMVIPFMFLNIQGISSKELLASQEGLCSKELYYSYVQYVRTHVCITYVCTRVCMYVCIYVCICIHICMYTGR